MVVIAWLTVLWTQPRQTEGRGLPLAVAPLMGLWLLFIWDSFGVRDPWSATWWVLAWSSAGLAGLYVWRQPQALSLIQRWLAGVGVFPRQHQCDEFSYLPGTKHCSVQQSEYLGRLAARDVLVQSAPGARGSEDWLLPFTFAGCRVYGIPSCVVEFGADRYDLCPRCRGKWLGSSPCAGILVFIASDTATVDRLADDPTAFGRPAWCGGLQCNFTGTSPVDWGLANSGWHAMTYRPAFEGAPVYRYLKGAPGESAHSEWVQLLVDHGWGDPFCCSSLALALRRGHRHLLAYGLVALALHGLFDGTFQSEAIRILLVIYFVAVCLTPGSRAIRLPAWTAPIALVLFSVPALASLPTGLASWLCRSGTAAFQEARALPKGRRQQERAKAAEKRFRQATAIDPRRARYPGRLAALLTWQFEQGYVAESAALDAQLQALKLHPIDPIDCGKQPTFIVVWVNTTSL